MLGVENPTSHGSNSTATLPADLARDASASGNGPPQRVLVVEDMDDSRASLVQLLEMALGLEVDAAENGEQALKMLAQRTYSLVITDLRMPKVGGMKLIHEIRERDVPVTIIVTTGHGSIKDAVDAMRMGAYDFLPKPADPQHLTLLVRKALKDRELRDEVTALRAQLGTRAAFRNVLSRSPKMHDVFELVAHVAETDSTVLIIGETGSGKEEVARALHNASSSRRTGPFVPVNCAALPETLLESELFGHEKGAFTGAAGQRKGRFEQANKGTLFLDEVGDIPAAMQVKLLRVLQDRRFERLGGTEPIEVDVRVIAATHQPIEKLVRDGKFRDDLYYRLNVVRVDLPPLRERPEDIPVLVQHFCQRFARPGRPACEVSPEAMEVLLRCHWPGNVRQLENAVERACVTARDGLIRPHNLPPDVAGKGVTDNRTGLSVDLSRSLPEQLAELTAAFEERYLRKALRKTRGHVGKCATLSGLSRRSITDKITLYKIDKEQLKRD
jgi:DNA-binding NtrC family response regulator